MIPWHSAVRFLVQLLTLWITGLFYLGLNARLVSQVQFFFTSILVPLLFTLNMLPQGPIMSKFGVSYHFYYQMVQNAAACLLMGSCKWDHITPISCSWHWLPVQYRIDYKIQLFVYKALNNLASKYLSDLIVTYNPSKSLTVDPKMVIFSCLQSRAHLQHREDRAFAVAGPKLWNSLTLPVRTAPTLAEFKSMFKTYKTFFLCF